MLACESCPDADAVSHQRIQRSAVQGRPSPVASVASGLVFGVALTAAGFHDPSLVVDQMKLQNWHMVRAFLMATASSIAVYAVAEGLGIVRLPAKSSSPLALFSPYDGNALGGALLGAGVALSGSCPGSLYPQLAAGVKSAFYTLAGAVAGGTLWSGALSDVMRIRQRDANVQPVPHAVHEGLRLGRTTAQLLFGVVCLAGVAATSRYASPSASLGLTGSVAGLLIGAAQLVSIYSRGALLGASGAFAEAGRLLLDTVGGGGTRTDAKPSRYPSLVFASSVTAGALGLMHVVPTLADGPVLELPPLLAAVGGVMMSVGAAVAGGCTSGHGISGMALLSTSSFVTIVSLFATGAVVAPLVY